MKPSPKPSEGLIFNLVSILLLALTPVLGRIATRETDPVSVAFSQNLLSAGCSYLLSLRAPRPILSERLDLRAVVGSALANAAGSLLLFVAIAQVGPVVVGFFGRLVLVFGIVFSVAWFRERLTGRELVWIIATIAAALSLSSPDQSLELEGSAAAIGYAFFFALSNALMKVASRGTGSAALVAACSGTSALLIGAYVAGSRGLLALFTDFFACVHLAAAMALAQSFGMIFYVEAVRGLPYATLNLMRVPAPFVVALYSAAVFPSELAKVNWPTALLMTLFLLGYTYEKIHPRHSRPRDQ